MNVNTFMPVYIERSRDNNRRGGVKEALGSRGLI